ncbi:MAG: signal transduction histidine kinase, LytS [Bacteroidetes bacterium]|jgi:LytS/YehU family sensor histidine kinase|nr:signal transduction histidine kinase, LytS [Bacteroidota bacterium]MDF2452656.1 signal transduction histidine kinase, LytS [Bacteroidota bacterium]
MANKKNIYWTCQVGGWTFFAALNLFFFKLSYSTNVKDILNYLIWLPVGITITHLFRYLVLKFNVLRYSIFYQIPIVVISGFINAFLFFALTIGIAKGLGIITYKIDVVAAVSNILSLTVIFVFWSLIYFGFHFFDNYKKTEIQNLKLEANTKEVELNKLKSQLNPHFMFNSMNSIRALVDEDPKKAKVAITQLSNILRNTLMMHKNKYITLEEELVLVKDYLELEHIRFEERLCFFFDIDPTTLSLNVPPMMIQTLVENGIKHGISKYPEGGSISINTKKLENTFLIEIINTGQLQLNNKSDSGFGVENTMNRLELLFGSKASFSLKNLDNKNVISKIIIKT